MAQRESLQGADEFYTEIEFMSRCHHCNLVKLVGYCDDEGEQMPGGTLRHQMESKKNGGPILDCPTHLRIAVGSARGILYLHTEADPPIIHRDIKVANILVDNLMVAKVADFGLSKQAPVPDIDGNTANHISTGVKGTPGYIDPEYNLTYQLTEKSDVFSFGVVLLELITGTRAISKGKNFVQEVQLRDGLGQILTLVDPDVVHYPWGTLELFMRLALRCCERLPEEGLPWLRSFASWRTLPPAPDSSPDGYTLDMSHPNEVDSTAWDDSQNSLHSASERSDTAELLSKTVTFVRPRY